MPKKDQIINPKDNHISFQCESMGAVEKKLKETEFDYVRQRVEGGIYVDQLFFHDPDGFMIEICNCDNLRVIPLTGEMNIRSCSRINLQMTHQNDTQSLQAYGRVQLSKISRLWCCNIWCKQITMPKCLKS